MVTGVLYRSEDSGIIDETETIDIDAKFIALAEVNERYAKLVESKFRKAKNKEVFINITGLQPEKIFVRYSIMKNLFFKVYNTSSYELNVFHIFGSGIEDKKYGFKLNIGKIYFNDEEILIPWKTLYFVPSNSPVKNNLKVGFTMLNLILQYENGERKSIPLFSLKASLNEKESNKIDVELETLAVKHPKKKGDSYNLEPLSVQQSFIAKQVVVERGDVIKINSDKFDEELKNHNITIEKLIEKKVVVGEDYVDEKIKISPTVAPIRNYLYRNELVKADYIISKYEAKHYSRKITLYHIHTVQDFGRFIITMNRDKFLVDGKSFLIMAH